MDPFGELLHGKFDPAAQLVTQDARKREAQRRAWIFILISFSELNFDQDCRFIGLSVSALRKGASIR